MDLAITTTRAIRDGGLTQVQATEVLGVTQPDVPDLGHGLSGWSIERLTHLVNRLGQDVGITVRRARYPEQGHLQARLASRPPERSCS